MVRGRAHWIDTSVGWTSRWRLAGVAALFTLIDVTCAPIELPRESGNAASIGAEVVEQADTAELALPEFAESISVGDRLPELELVDQAGESFNLADLRGTVVVLGFFSCQHPVGSPGRTLAQRLLELQESLRPDLWDRVTIVSVSVEPSRDIPVALRRCSLGLGADPDRWILAMSPARNFSSWAARLGVVIWQEEGGAAHTLSTLVVDQDGVLADRFPGLTQWTVDDLIAAVVHTAER